MYAIDIVALSSTNSPGDSLAPHAETHRRQLRSSIPNDYAPPLLCQRVNSSAHPKEQRCATTNTPTTAAAPPISTCTRTCVRRTQPMILPESSSVTNTTRSVSICEKSAHFVQWHRRHRHHCWRRRARHSDTCCTSRRRLITRCWMGGGRILVQQRRIVRNGWKD
jgi:hypothetical protein